MKKLLHIKCKDKMYYYEVTEISKHSRKYDIFYI